MGLDITFVDRELDRVNKSIRNEEFMLNDLQASIALLEETKEFMTKVLYLKKTEMNILIEIVNRGLAFIYPEKHLVFDMKFEDRNNRVIPEFYLGDNKLEKDLIGNGGGCLEVIGLLIYITFLKLKNVKIALIDEKDSMVDSTATELLIEFLDYFSKENDISILIISHKNLEGYDETQITDKIKMLKLI